MAADLPLPTPGLRREKRVRDQLSIDKSADGMSLRRTGAVMEERMDRW